jgi:hypothetical protein
MSEFYTNSEDLELLDALEIGFELSDYDIDHESLDEH